MQFGLLDFIEKYDVNMKSQLECISSMDYMALVAAVFAIEGNNTPVTLDFLWRETSFLSCYVPASKGLFADFIDFKNPPFNGREPRDGILTRDLNWYYKLPADYICALKRVVYNNPLTVVEKAIELNDIDQAAPVVETVNLSIRGVPRPLADAFNGMKASGDTSLSLTKYMIEAFREKLKRDGAL